MSDPVIRKTLTIEEMYKVLSDATNLSVAKAKGRVHLICQFLEVTFGSESQSLQTIVRTITDLDALSGIIAHILEVSHSDEANALIRATMDKMDKIDARERWPYDMQEKASMDRATYLEEAREKGYAKGLAEGMKEMKVEIKATLISNICQYLKTHFGKESQALQDIVNTITDLNMIIRIAAVIHDTATLVEAEELIQARGKR